MTRLITRGLQTWSMPTEIESTLEWKRSSHYFQRINSPAFNKISGGSDPQVSPCGRFVAFNGTTLKTLDGGPTSRVCIASTTGTELQVLDNSTEDSQDKIPRWSPDGKLLAFLSNRQHKAKYAAHFIPISNGRFEYDAQPQRIDSGEGTVTCIEWSPSGKQLLLLTTDEKGAFEELRKQDSWRPTIVSAAATERFALTYDLERGSLRKPFAPSLTIWEACWCGEDTLACIVSDGATENDWYRSRLSLLSISNGIENVLHRSSVQLGVPACSPNGSQIAVIEALCSDRGAVAGNILIVSRDSGCKGSIRPQNTDVTHIRWRDEETLFFTGLRGLHISAGDINVRSNAVNPFWSSKESCGPIYPTAAPIAGQGNFCLFLESWSHPPELCMVREGQTRRILSLEHSGSDWQRAQLGAVTERTWKSSDGLEIQGYLYLPTNGKPPYPLILSCHGGPVWCFRNRWPGNQYIAFLVSQGYAVLTVNQRGSASRGQEFAHYALGDTGGQETADFLSGIDVLVQDGIADANKLGITGVSYGGYMAAWLITKDHRFKASVPIAAVTDWRSFHLESNIALQPQLFMNADPYGKGGLYHERSPTMAANRIRTPVFQVSGEQDRCVPSSQAMQLHQALLEHQVPSALAIYPEEGHGIANFPALIDFCARTLLWFNHYLLGDSGRPGCDDPV